MNSLHDIALFLAFECPFKHEYKDCVFSAIRKLDVEERFDKINGMDFKKIEAMISHHKTCISKRESIIQRNYVKQVME